tara:strand:+ start:159 stop:416 length:258 start_codon:yes stop_codon:yes gene_type:complete
VNTGISGSSPRLWGTRQPDADVVAQLRFIPTPVGNTAASLSVNTVSAVHPHACGEHAEIAQEVAERVRFIPTPVGNTPLDLELLK